MRKFFYPKNIAVAGASSDEIRMTNNILTNLMEVGYQGEIFPVGQKGKEIFGYRIYRSLQEIQKDIDLLVIMVPAVAVPDLLRDAGKAGVDRAVLITAGFNELGGDRDLLTREIKEIAEKYSIRFIGPNCQGVICTESNVCVPFWPAKRELIKKGGVSVISQSGSIAASSTFVLSHEIDGINKVASIGNKLDVDELELLEYLIEDPETKIIILHLESFSNGRKLIKLARNSEKPIIVFKSNISGKTSQIALSHTAAIASDDRVVEAALAQAGVLRAYSFTDMIEMCKALSLPLIAGKNLAVLAGSGGMGIIGEDTAQRENLHMAEFPALLIQKIRTMGNWKLHKIINPLDLGNIFNNKDILSIIDTILSFDEVDGMVFSIFDDGPPMFEPYECSEVVDHVQGISKKRSKPVAMHIVSNPFFLAQLRKDKVFPTFDTVEDAVCALSTQWKYREFLNRVHSPYLNMEKEKKKAGEILAKATDAPLYPSDLTAMELVSAYGIRCEIPVMAANLEEARLKATEIAYPVAMKISSPDISHKSDVGGVRVNIEDEAALEKTFREMMTEVKKRTEAVQIQGVMLQKMIHGGMELIIGGKHDKDFGPVVMFGMGGIFVEVFEDVSFRLAPICREEAYEMIEETKGYSLLKGVRGEKPFDLSSLADVLERFSILLVDFPEISEMDLNPVKIFNDGRELIVLDGRLS
ncbi:MAG: acetate--CoA ligase family protein [Deltaproteobacteria bacterium]|nr:acetate--CoA ligase family protein [Deltaproteobacteria bacterium]